MSVAFRRLTADSWYVGKKVREDKAPFGQPLFLDITSLDATVSYGVTDRFSLSATVPFSRGTHSRFYADGLRHQVSVAGLGDLSVTGGLWLFNPRTHATGNVAVGVGVKASTGRSDATDTYYLPGGTMEFTVDQSIQLGDGGWGAILQAQGFRALFGSVSAYASGSYLVSPTNQTSVLQSPSGPYSSVHVSVPDVFNARAGVTFDVSAGRGAAAGIGARVDGIPMTDLIGRSDGFRRPAILGYLEPSVTLTRGRHTIAVSVPVRIYQDFRPGWVDRQLGTAGGGDLAAYLIFANYQRRF